MSLPDVVGVYGGGRMGAGIAHAFLLSAVDVVLVEVNDAAAVSARDRVSAGLATAIARRSVPRDPDSGQPPTIEQLLSRLTVTVDPSDLRSCGLIIEAVSEDIELKARVLGVAAEHAPHAVLATNTSSLSIDRLARHTGDPARFLGLHFFNPVPTSALVEIVVGSRTDAGVRALAQDWVAALGKTAIIVADSPGFASSRLGVALALEAMRMVQDGVASAADIDTAMTLGYRHPLGPLRTTDLVGLDVRLAIAEHLERELGPRFAPPRILRDKVSAGELGRKTGRGFYEWRSED